MRDFLRNQSTWLRRLKLFWWVWLLAGVLLGGCESNTSQPFRFHNERLWGVLGSENHASTRQWVVSQRAILCVPPVELNETFLIDQESKSKKLQVLLHSSLNRRFRAARMMAHTMASSQGCHYEVQAELLLEKNRINSLFEWMNASPSDAIGSDKLMLKISLSETQAGSLLDVTTVSLTNAWLVTHTDHFNVLLSQAFDLYAQQLTSASPR